MICSEHRCVFSVWTQNINIFVLIKMYGEIITQVAGSAQAYLGSRSRESLKLPDENEAYLLYSIHAWKLEQ